MVLYNSTQISNSYNGFWLGLKQNGSSWQWIDDTPYDYSNWQAGELKHLLPSHERIRV